MFNEVHDWLLPEGAAADDAEALYVFGLMASIWVLGDVREWDARSERYRARYRALLPGGVDPEVFRGRGAYGDYFIGQAVVPGGY